MDQQEDNLKAQQRNDAINSVYPKMDLKTVGGMTKSQNKISRNSSFSDTVQEEIDKDESEKDEMAQSMTKSKFKHVNIITDSDEFNQHKVSEQTNTMMSSQQIQRIRSTSSDQAFGESIQEDKIEEESEVNNSPSKLSTSKLGIMNHPIEEAILLDKGEFDCSTPTRPKPSSLLKKVSSQTQYSQFNQKEETITEDPEKETDGIYVARISSHKEIKIKVDEIDTDKSKQFTPRINYMENSVPIIEETKEEDLVEGNKQFQTAKQEREQEMGYIKKIVKGDTIHEGEKLVHMAETSGMTSHMASNQINENQQDEDIEDNDEEDIVEVLQKRRRSSLNIDSLPPQEEEQNE
ncbi:hypothetical protein TTHERM_01094850 (macronuclear) [Tetrahymena thermophila SB210]|uniref:Uncharacterized protein n=1 Tax=Tetrahymena thermophila (strain SB210) TaxID=312017 RepID=Q22ZH5_TETTS|nr:hypothetical protein TTHERM_01094850 [Tetrahymena thermophila SB210]EAR90672.2 hypothetical protein TTHERM_01094850 [Tetrahymena thermophila SB210]|eukprot:XP_001010917.2 hypothetical protein TTHERM_01094850 [Tetrahymena thermophila SB210]